MAYYDKAKAPALADMLALPTFDMQRAAVRKALDHLAPTALDRMDATNNSPLCGPLPNQLDLINASWPRFRDALPMEVMLGLLSGVIVWEEVFQAIKEPAAKGIASSRSKTGYSFGWPDTASLKGIEARIEYDAKAQGWVPTPTAPVGAIAPGTLVTIPTTSTKEPHAPMTTDLTAMGVAPAIELFDAAATMYAIKAEKDYSGIGTMPDDAAVESDLIRDCEGLFGVDNFKSIRAAVMLRAVHGKRPDYKMPVRLDATGKPVSLTAEQYAVYAAIMAGPGYTAGVTAPVEHELSTPAPVATPPILVSPGLAAAINTLLVGDTKGKLSDINAILSGVVTLQSKNASLEATIADLRSKPTLAAVAFSGDAGSLTWEIRQANAAKLWGYKGAGAAVLNFDVPTIVWKDAGGDEVRHPLCEAIDSNYKFFPPVLAAVLWSIVKNRVPWVYGHTGTGKTTLIQQVASKLGFPCIRVNLDSEITRTDLVGSTQIKAEGSGTTSYFREGIVPQALQMPCFLLFDEIDFVRSDVAYVLQRVLETHGMRLDEDGGRLITPHPWFRMFATANTRGQGDEFGMYPGAKPQTAAFLDRFFPWVEVDYLKADIEAKLLVDTVPGLDPADAAQITKFGGEVRVAFSKGEIAQVMSPRGLGGIADNYVFFKRLTPKPKDAFDFACKLGAFAKATAQDAPRIKELADRCFK